MKTDHKKSQIAALISLIGCTAGTALATPEGGQVIMGNASVSRSGATIDVIQQSERAVIDWNSFDLSAEEQVRFNQPGVQSITLNRIHDIKPSQIDGRITANGQIILVNLNGLVFGNNAVVDVNSLVATSTGIDPMLFMNGELKFDQLGKPDAAIVNKGQISAAQAGLVALVSPQVANHGIIQARLGKIQIASANAFTLDIYGDGLIELKLSDDVAQQLIEHSGTLDAQGGMILLQAAAGKQIVDSLINIEGELKAPSVLQQGGKIIITGDTIHVKAGTHIDASGAKGGGEILIGGDYQGQGSLPTAQRVTVDQGAFIQANATEKGDGGKVIVWADQHSTFGGAIEAKARGEGQQGGFVETSGKVKLTIEDSARVNTSAVNTKVGTWLLDPQDFSIGGTNADISAATLQTNLSGGNVSILSSTGGSAGTGNIHVNDAVAWSANNLTLTAAKDVLVNSVMSASGTASLTVNTGSTNGADTGVAGGQFRMALSDSGFTGRVDYSASGPLIINGNTYTVINSLGAAGSTTGTDLQGINGNLSGHYALGSNIDASTTSGWNAGAGFTPIGGTFSGSFNGLGHAIDGVTISRPGVDDTGLFSFVNGNLSNVGVTNANVMGGNDVAILAAELGGGVKSVFNAYTTGQVSASGLSVGGLIGYMGVNSLVENSFSKANVSSTNSFIGGLIGSGFSDNTIRNSYATGTVSGVGHVGGLLGIFFGGPSNVVTGSYATGAVNGTNDVGGLIGTVENGTSLTNSFASGNVTATGQKAGGLVGSAKGSSSITRSFASGSVMASQNAGGLVGDLDGSNINNSFATGAVHAAEAGGAVGVFNNGSTLSNVYAAGLVTGSSLAGGLAATGVGTASNSFWNTVTTGQATSVGGGTGLNAIQMRNISNFSGAGWSISGTPGAATWTIRDGLSMPSLAAASVNLQFANKTYDGLTYGATNAPTVLSSVRYYAGSIDTFFPFQITGTATGTGALWTAANAGTYAIGDVTGLTSAQHLLVFSHGSSVDINKALLTISPNSFTRTYGDANPLLTGTITGFKNSETAAVLGTQPTYTTTASQTSGVGTYNITANGATASNYDFAYNTGTLTVNKALLTVSPNSFTRTYGDANPLLTGAITGFKNSETSAVLGTQPTYTTTASQTSGVGTYNITANGATASNYDFAYNTGSLTINKAPLFVSLPSLTLAGSDLVTADLAKQFVYAGFKLNDGVENLDQLPAAVQTAAPNSGYFVRLTGGLDDNYDFNLATNLVELKLDLRNVDSVINLRTSDFISPVRLNVPRFDSLVWKEREIEEREDIQKYILPNQGVR